MAFHSAAGDIYIDITVPNFDGKRGEVITPTREASTAFHVVAPAVPIAG